jgi:hypothetical protein
MFPIIQEENLDSMENRNFIQSFDNLYNLKRQGRQSSYGMKYLNFEQQFLINFI